MFENGFSAKFDRVVNDMGKINQKTQNGLKEEEQKMNEIFQILVSEMRRLESILGKHANAYQAPSPENWQTLMQGFYGPLNDMIKSLQSKTAALSGQRFANLRGDIVSLAKLLQEFKERTISQPPKDNYFILLADFQKRIIEPCMNRIGDDLVTLEKQDESIRRALSG